MKNISGNIIKNSRNKIEVHMKINQTNKQSQEYLQISNSINTMTNKIKTIINL